MRLTKMNYEKAKAYRTIEEAIEATEFEEEELNNEKSISVGIGIDAEGNRWYAVGSFNDFFNCNYADLDNVDEWFESEWIEKEEKEFYTHSFDSYEELTEWLNSRKNDNRKVYYYGFMENFDGTLYNIADIASDVSSDWFEDGATVEIYEEA